MSRGQDVKDKQHYLVQRPEAETCLASTKNSKDANEYRAKIAKGKVVGADVSDVAGARIPWEDI